LNKPKINNKFTYKGSHIYINFRIYIIKMCWYKWKLSLYFIILYFIIFFWILYFQFEKKCLPKCANGLNKCSFEGQVLSFRSLIFLIWEWATESESLRAENSSLLSQSGCSSQMCFRTFSSSALRTFFASEIF
jgi:hypothetical protein